MAKPYIQKVLYRIESYVERFPNTEIWVLANKQESAKIYWKQISRNIKTNDIKPLLVTSRVGLVDSLNPRNALILVCGEWWKNSNANTFMDMYLNMADKVIPVDQIPYIEI